MSQKVHVTLGHLSFFKLCGSEVLKNTKILISGFIYIKLTIIHEGIIFMSLLNFQGTPLNPPIFLFLPARDLM